MAKAMQHIDHDSIVGSGVTIGFTIIGIMTTQELALWIGIAAGATTIILNFVKIIKELLK